MPRRDRAPQLSGREVRVKRLLNPFGHLGPGHELRIGRRALRRALLGKSDPAAHELQVLQRVQELELGARLVDQIAIERNEQGDRCERKRDDDDQPPPPPDYPKVVLEGGVARPLGGIRCGGLARCRHVASRSAVAPSGPAHLPAFAPMIGSVRRPGSSLAAGVRNLGSGRQLPSARGGEAGVGMG